MAGEYGGLRPTGRQDRDPAAILVELESEDAFAHTAIAFDATFRGHRALDLDVRLVLPFLEFPMATGVVDLSWADPARGVFVYPTGTAWTLHDVLRYHNEKSRKIGLRSALEIGILCAEMLVEAGQNGREQGCFSHGNLNPWRIMLRDDGQVQVIGYGLPQIELVMRKENPSFAVGPDSYRYCPPERLAGSPEDTAADTASLALVMYEVVTGKSLYAGNDVAALERSVSMSEGVQMLARPPSDLPKPVAEVLSRGLVFDPETRLSGADFAADLRKHLKGAAGPALADVMAEVAAAKPMGDRPRKKVIKSTGTSVFDRAALAAQLSEDDDEEAAEAAPKSAGRWAAPARRQEAPAPAAPAPERQVRREAPAPERQVHREPTPAAGGEVRRRLRTEEPAAAPVAAPTPAVEGGDQAAPEGTVRRRLRREPEPVAAAPAAAAPPPAPAPAEPAAEGEVPRRRVLRREDAEGSAAPAEGVRRRLRREGE